MPRQTGSAYYLTLSLSVCGHLAIIRDSLPLFYNNSELQIEIPVLTPDKKYSCFLRYRPGICGPFTAFNNRNGVRTAILCPHAVSIFKSCFPVFSASSRNPASYLNAFFTFLFNPFLGYRSMTLNASALTSSHPFL